MGLNSLQFIIRFAMLMCILCTLQIVRGRHHKSKASAIQLSVILTFSYCFVLAVDYRYALCIAIITVVTYLCGLLAERNRIAALWGSVLLIAVLFYFKYAGFFLKEFECLF